jgi:hypothetical protein
MGNAEWAKRAKADLVDFCFKLFITQKSRPLGGGVSGLVGEVLRGGG